MVDFDHHSDAFNLNELAINAELRQRCPVAWNENYGGFWFLSSYDAVSHTARDGDTFAHKYEPNAARRRRLPGRDGRPAPGRPAGAGHRRGRRPLPPSATARAGPVLLPRRRPETQALHGAIGALVPRPKNRRGTDGPRPRLRQPGPGHPHHEADGPALRQLAPLRRPLPLRHGSPPGQRRIPQRHRQSARHDGRGHRVRDGQTRQTGRRPDQLPHPVRIRRPAPHRRTAAQHPVEPHRRRRRHHHLADRADAATPGHPPGAPPTTHRPPGALPHRHRRIPALLLGQPNPKPHSHSRRRTQRPTPPQRTTESSSAGSPPTTTRKNSQSPTRSSWTAHPTVTSPSDSGRTAASAHTWRG